MKNFSLGQLLAEGRTAEVYEIDQAQVVKLFFEWVPERWVKHEFDIAKEISSLALPTPKAIELIEVDGRHGISYERVDGLSMLSAFLSKPWLVIKYARKLAELQNDIHKYKGLKLPSHRTALIETVQRLIDLPAETKSKTLSLLDTLSDGDSLCHLDFHPDQVIMSESGPVIIDWLTAKLGHPLSDVARTCVLLKFSQPSYGGWAIRTLVNLFRTVYYYVYLSRYLYLNPLATREEITQWMIPVAVARLDENVPGEHDAIIRFVQAQLSL